MNGTALKIDQIEIFTFELYKCWPNNQYVIN